MGRHKALLRVRKAALKVELEQLRCQRLGLRPSSTYRRNRGWLVPLGGFVAGCIAGSISARTSLSGLISTGFAAMRLQPLVAHFIKSP
ncbi:hypothetical protein PHACT_04025 [Pseudohongiella acticola]|jgi:hypothetical protein|uniref:Uncharacterized protein n=1 Tax=Pseudohongiella acticola TaxID=1524254 RepID=A0A1E8CIY0_9GAMM|nr:hypothetical protein PHACT_04025 [Pseudohongiella acticola]|tara:strand:- start:67 stop:330 length:264 start_codon:yes stop_codon:yes gene_type:complete